MEVGTGNLIPAVEWLMKEDLRAYLVFQARLAGQPGSNSHPSQVRVLDITMSYSLSVEEFWEDAGSCGAQIFNKIVTNCRCILIRQ